DHGTTDHFRLEAYLVDRPHHADRVGGIGADDDEVRIRLRNRPHHRHEVGGCRWISAVIHNREAGRFGILARSFRGVEAVSPVGPPRWRLSSASDSAAPPGL